MTFNKYKSLLAAGVFVALSACTTEVDDFVSSGGAASDGTPIDFTTYVALGNSLTAGYTDNGWIAKAQNNSYPQLIANSLQAGGLGAQGFKQPRVDEDKPYFGVPAILTNNVDVGPCFDCSTPQAPSKNIYSGHGGFHNMAVPGIRAVDMPIDGYGQLNPYFGYFQSSATTSVLKDAAVMNATFFSMWLGANDVLGFATNGGSKGTNDIMKATAISPQSAFEGSITAVLDAMTANGAKGVVLNIPDITEAALFNTVPASLALDEATATSVNALMASLINPQIEAQVHPAVEAQKSTVLGLITPNPIFEGVNFVTVAIGSIQIKKGDNTYVPSSIEIATEIVYLQAFQAAKAGGASDEQANDIATAYLESQKAQGEISGLVMLGINANWAAMTGSDEDFETVKDDATAVAIQGLKDAKQYPVFAGGANMLPVMDTTSVTGILQPEEGSLFTLNAIPKLESLDSLLKGQILPPADLSKVLPVLKDGEALLKGDVDKVKAAINEYNAFLKSQAEARDLAFVDTKSVMNDAATSGIIIDGVTYTTAYLSGNLFSLDGAHLTQRGYAVIGNYTIQAINAQYGAKIPQIQQNDFPVVETTVVPTPAQ